MILLSLLITELSLTLLINDDECVPRNRFWHRLPSNAWAQRWTSAASWSPREGHAHFLRYDCLRESPMSTNSRLTSFHSWQQLKRQGSHAISQI